MKVLVKYWPKPPTKHRLEILVAPTRKRAAALLGLKRLPYPDFKLRSGWVEIGRGDRGKTRIAGIKIDGVELPDEIQFREILSIALKATSASKLRWMAENHRCLEFGHDVPRYRTDSPGPRPARSLDLGAAHLRRLHHGACHRQRTRRRERVEY